MKLRCLLFFLISNLIIQLNAQPPPPPECSNYAGVDFFPFYGNEICGDYGAFFELFVITNGPPMGEFYDVIVFGTDGSQGFGFADDYGFGFVDIFPEIVEGCEPVEVSYEMIITCPYTGEELDVIDLGAFTIYPQLMVEVVEPGCGEGENGSATLVTFDGTICDGPIEGIAGSGGDCETQQPGVLTYNFNPFPNALYCFFNYTDVIEIPCTELEFGCIDPAACNFSETAVCDDGSCVFIEPCCPRPIAETLPTGICPGGYYPDTNICIAFDGDISAIDIPGMNIFSANGGFGFPASEDPATNEVCFFFYSFYYYYDFCLPFEDTFTLEYFCYDTGEFVSIDLGTITFYPPPFAFDVFSQPSPECGGTPEVFPPECGELVIGEIVPPINDCDNLTPGIVNYDIDPGFDITNAPECFTTILASEIPIPPCEEDCPCDGVFCGGTCTDLMVTANGLPQVICNYYGSDPITIDITGQGASTSSYFGNILTNGNQVDGFFHQLGDPTTFNIFPFFYGPGITCEPVTYPLEYEIFCASDGTLLASGLLGDITVYPEPFLFFPEIIEGQPCGAGATILPAPCGTVVTDPEPIPNPQCGEVADDQIVTWSIDLGFDATNAPECFDPSFLTGEFIIFGCPDNPGDPCFLECLGDGTLDENCNCMVEDAPQLEIVGDPLVAVCQGEPFQVDINLTGTIPPGQFYELQVVDQNGFFINSFFIDDYTVFPLTVDLFDFYYYEPCNIREVTYTFTLRCFYDFSIIGTPLTVGPITIYPSPFNYTPFIDPAIPCESDPVINLFGYCPATLEIIETVPPVDDCDAPLAGYVSYQIVPEFDITNAPACFTNPLAGQAPIPPCLIDCPCDGTFCQGVCVDLMATASDLPAEICSDYGFQYQLDITGLGADFGTYFILTFDNNGFNIGFDVHNSGDPTTLFPFLNPFVQGCEPEEQTFTYQIQCPDDGSILASGTIGTVLVYPSPFNFFPNITPSIACVQDLMITPAPCGTIILNPDPIPVPGCGGEDTEVSWSVDFGFEYPPNCYAFPIEGTETIFGCNGTPGDPCDDNNACTTGDTLDENCICVGEGPTAMLNSPLPASACTGEPFILTVTVDMIPDPDGLFVVINDNFNNYPGFVFLAPGDPLTVDVEIFPFTQQPCNIQDLELFLQLFCPVTYNTIGAQVPLGSVTIFPNANSFIPQIQPANECGVAPAIFPPQCGNLVLNEVPADPVACPVGNDGVVEYTVDTGFDVSTAPDCFDVSLLSGEEPITACSNCCPLVVDASVANPGPFCNGDMTEVCVTFGAPFETDAQVTINGIDAVAGEDQICFQLNLVNVGCSFEPVQVPYEIICNIDGTIENGLSPGVIVAPDPTNFQYQVFPGGCGFPPFVGPPNGPVTCFVFSNTSVVVTDPLDGCPPIEGEVEVTLDYFDNNFNPLDVSSIPCDGFPASIILPQPGCSSCACPNPPANITLTENVCEGNTIEICVEFEVGDEANAIGTQVNIGGDILTSFSFVISGDGTSTSYCSEFVPAPFIDCAPVTENFNINFVCPSDGMLFFTGAASATVYPSLAKFSYEVTPAVDNCPLPTDYPEIISTGECDLDIFDVITVDPVDGCPPLSGSTTYSIYYLNGPLFTNAPVECLFTEVANAVEPIPGCATCDPDCSIVPEMVTNIVCSDNGTPDDASDDTYTFDITVNGNNTASGATNTFNDDQGNSGIVYGTTVSYGPYPIAGGNVMVSFTDADDANCIGMMMATAPPTCSVDAPCEDEIMGMVIAPTGCNVAGITVTIYDAMGNVTTTLTTDGNGVYDSSPTVYPCGDYTAELTANITTCYSDANGETGPKLFTIDDDPDNTDTDGTDFQGTDIPCEDEISGTVIPPAGCSVAGVTVTIYDGMGNVVTTLTTVGNGVYDSSPTVYPCGDYTAELTANIPACYSNANGETGPKPFTIDDDPNDTDTDGTDFIAEEPEPPTCSISVEISEIVCDNNETPQDGSDDIVTITVTVTSTGPWTAGDGTTGNNGDTYTFPATLANNALSMMFSVDGETDCETVFTTIANDCDVPAIPTLSQWGLIILCLLMMSYGAIRMRTTTVYSQRA